MSLSSCDNTGTNWPHNVKERVLTCTICLEFYLDPKIIPCFHTFCKNCLLSHVLSTLTTERFPCPLCRTEIRLPKGGVDSFQSNFYIQEITELMRQDSDTTKHTLTLAANHVKTDSDRATLKNCMLYQDLYCPTHAYRKEWVVSYCRRCRVPICMQCKLHEHSGHDWESLGVVVDEAQKELAALDENVRKSQKHLRGLSRDRSKHMATFCEEFSRVSEQVRSNAEDIKQKVDFRCEALLLLLDHLKVTEAGRVESHNTQVMDCALALEDVKQGVDRMLKGSNVLNLLASTLHLQETADDVIGRIPATIEKCTLVYDRRNTEGLGESIEAAMGYLSSQRDSSMESDVEMSVESDALPGLDLEQEPELSQEAPVDVISEPDQLQPGPARRVRLVTKVDFKVTSKNAAVKFIVAIPHMGTLIGYDNSKQIDVVNHVGYRTQALEGVGSASCALLVGQNCLAICTASPRQFIQTRMPNFFPISYYKNLSIIPTGIAIRNASELIICGKDKSGVGTGIYRLCLETKEMIAVYTNTSDHHVLKAPCAVVVTEDDDTEMFVVADSKRKSVFYFSTQGSLLHTFPSRRCSFCPEGLCRDLEGNIVVADKGNNSVVVLSPRGTFKHELVRGINPRVVAFDDFGRLWIGKSEGTVTINDYFV